MTGQEKFVAFIKLQLKHAGYDMPAPDEYIEPKAVSELSREGYNAWVDCKIALNNVSEKDRKTVVRLLVHKMYTVFEVMDEFRSELTEESKELLDYIRDHMDELRGNSEAKLATAEDFEEFFESLNDDE